jgi:hypothetical protein
LDRNDVIGALCAFGSALLLMGSAVAQDTAPPQALRFDVGALVGYRTSISFPTQSGSSNPRVVLDASPSYGATFGVRLDEQNLVAFRWTRQDTRAHLDNAAPGFAAPRATLDQFHGDFTHEYVLDSWGPWARPFVIGSVGATRAADGAHSSFTRFSFGLGGGIKIFASRHWGFQFQGEWLPIWVDPEVEAFICGGGCVVRLGGSLSSQGQFSAGPLLRF